MYLGYAPGPYMFVLRLSQMTLYFVTMKSGIGLFTVPVYGYNCTTYSRQPYEANE
jgi:hypothetical protein